MKFNQYIKIFAISLLVIAVGFNVWQNYKDSTQVKEFSREYFQQLAEGTGATQVRAFTSITVGGGTGALDKIDGDLLNDGDVAIVVTSDGAYFYTLDATSIESPSTPKFIAPYTNAGTKMWVLTTLNGDAVTTIPQDNAALDYEPENTGETRYYVGPNHDGESDDDDDYEIRRSATPGTNVDFRVFRSGLQNANRKEDKVTQDYQEVQMAVFDWTTDVTTGNGKFYFTIDQKLHQMNLSYCHAQVITAGTTGTTAIWIYNMNAPEAHAAAHDMLYTPDSRATGNPILIDSGETTSSTATGYVINTPGVVERDVIRIDISNVSTTPPKGLIITLGFSIP